MTKKRNKRFILGNALANASIAKKLNHRVFQAAAKPKPRAAQPAVVSAVQPVAEIRAVAAAPATAARIDTSRLRDLQAHTALRVDPRLFRVAIPSRPTGKPGVSESELSVPFADARRANDTLVFTDPVDADTRYYLPRYRLDEHAGRYDIGVSATLNGNWEFTLRLIPFPAPQVARRARDAVPIEHDLHVFLRYAAGAGSSIERRVEFEEIEEASGGITARARLTLVERDRLMGAMQRREGQVRLVVRRQAEVALKRGKKNSAPKPSVLMKDRMRATADLGKRFASKSLADSHRLRLAGLSTHFAGTPTQGPTEDAPYQVQTVTLDDAVDPAPLHLDPQLHSYLYAQAGGSVGRRDLRFRRITHRFPEKDGRFHSYLQDLDEPWRIYFLPDKLQLARENEPPFLPMMNIRIESPDGTLESAVVIIDYVVEPVFDMDRLDAAAEALIGELPAHAGDREIAMEPLAATGVLNILLPAEGGQANTPFPDVEVDLANGFAHSLTVPMESFRQLFAAAVTARGSGLFSGNLVVETQGNHVEQVPFAVRFGETDADLFIVRDVAEDGVRLVSIINAIESPFTLQALSINWVAENGLEETAQLPAALDLPKTLAPGERMVIPVPAPGNDQAKPVVELEGVEVNAVAENILPLISDNSVPAEYFRQVEVMTVAALLGEPGSGDEVLLVNLEFEGGGSARVTRDETSQMIDVRLSMLDWLLRRDTLGSYRFRQQIVRQNGTQSVDERWRESDLGLLVVPISDPPP